MRKEKREEGIIFENQTLLLYSAHAKSQSVTKIKSLHFEKKFRLFVAEKVYQKHDKYL